MDGREKPFQLAKGIIVASIGIGLAYIVTKYSSKYVSLIRRSLRLRKSALHCKQLHIIDRHDQQVTLELKKECEQFRALGFDCEWVTENGRRRPVALLQLASKGGVCMLYRLCKLRCLPQPVIDLLEDCSVLKVGVGSLEDARLLAYDYGVQVRGCLDVRHLARARGLPGGGLAALTSALLGAHLHKDWRVRCSDWEARELSESQVQYAAQDALAGVLVFAHLVDSPGVSWPQVLGQCEGLVDVRPKERARQPQRKGGAGGGGKPQDWAARKQQYRVYSTLQRPMYDNCFLQAPDSQLLCTCDLGKAKWYLDKQLGTKVSEDPFIVRLNFEPASRDLPQYYMEVKANRCVVCGFEESYHKKFVVPQEYRKFFPKEMKDHQSHDVLLLCTRCHSQSNVCDQVLRQKLAQECAAPLCPVLDRSSGEGQYGQLQQVKSAARALLRGNAVLIPAQRRQQLERVLRDHLGTDAPLTSEQLHAAANIHISPRYKEHYEPHGSRVVRHYAAPGGPGLRTLEQMWRQHFLSSMQPRFLPRLWSVHHHHTREPR